MTNEYPDRVDRDDITEPPDYHPWRLLGKTEAQYWKDNYLEARRESFALTQALEFIRDCENDGEEMGPIVTVAFLKEQARAVLQRYPI